MAGRSVIQQAKQLAGKYRYVLLILAVGILLMLLPAGAQQKTQETTLQQTQTRQEPELARQLEEILSQLQGAGAVQVLLTESWGQQTHYQQDTQTQAGENGTQRQDTVIVSGADRAQEGLVQRIDPPVYRGAIIVCQGADSAAVRYGIIEAVARITGLGSDKISVLKMK